MFRVGTIAIGFMVCIGAAAAQEAPAVSADMAARAQALLDVLDPAQRKALNMPFDADERFQWHFVPGVRPGVALRDMTPDQQALALAAVEAGLSEEGFETEEEIRQLDQVLRDMGGGASRDPLFYYVMIFGEPAADGTWAMRLEGHHLSLHWTIVKGNVSLNLPQFLGANPAEVPEGELKGLRALGPHEDLGRQLVKSLSEEQRAKAIIADTAPRDFLSGNEREIQMTEHLGVPYNELTPEQQAVLISLIEHYAVVQVEPVAQARLQRVKDSLDTVTFAWMGSLESGEGHYYRIQGERFLIEYDNIQNNANHIHTVWRDVDGDFGQDLLKLHYEQHAHNPDHGHDHADHGE